MKEYTKYPEWNRLIEMIERLKPLMGVEQITILTDSSPYSSKPASPQLNPLETPLSITNCAACILPTFSLYRHWPIRRSYCGRAAACSPCMPRPGNISRILRP